MPSASHQGSDGVHQRQLTKYVGRKDRSMKKEKLLAADARVMAHTGTDVSRAAHRQQPGPGGGARRVWAMGKG
jgi:hypothetical protein